MFHQVFDNAATLITDAFDWSADFAGVDGCVGVEFPLTLPPALAAKNVSLLDAYTGRLPSTPQGSCTRAMRRWQLHARATLLTHTLIAHTNCVANNES